MAGTSQSALRYYDKIGLFSPAARGANNYRYYTPLQLITLKFIIVLADLGIPLTKIKELNSHRTPINIIKLLLWQESRLDREMHRLRTAYSIIHKYRDNIQNGLFANEEDICVEVADDSNECRVIFGPENDFRGSVGFYAPFIRFCESAKRNRINLNYPVGGYHRSVKAFLNAPGQPDRFISLDPMGDAKIPDGRYLVGYVRGYYGEFGDLPQRMASYAEKHNLELKGAVYVTYLLDEVTMTKPDMYLAKVAVGLSRQSMASENI